MPVHVTVSYSLSYCLSHLFIESLVRVIVHYIGIRSGIGMAKQQQMQLELPLPEISTEDFEKNSPLSQPFCAVSF